MQTDQIVNFCWGISIASIIAIGVMKLYSFGYERGYQTGRHIGVTKGLWLSAERKQKVTV